MRWRFAINPGRIDKKSGNLLARFLLAEEREAIKNGSSTSAKWNPRKFL